MPQLIQLNSLPKGFIKFIFLSCSMFLLYTTGFAQAAKNPAATDTTKVIKVIEPIALANIGTETETTLGKIREIREKIKPSNSELALDTLIPEKLKTVEKLKKDLDLEEIEKMNLRQTENLKNDISQIRNQLDDWRSSLTKKTEEINGLKLDLGEHRTAWDKTLKLEREEKLLQQVKERIQTNLKEINTLNKDLTERNNALLTKQDEMTGALIFLNEVLNTITKTEQAYRTQIFVIDSPPIWQMFSVKRDTLTSEQQMLSVERDTLTFKQRVHDITTRQNNDLKTFLENYRANISYHILFFVVLLLLSFYLKVDVAKWSDEKIDETIKSSLHIISKPFSASLLVSLLVTGLFYSEAPENVLNYYYVLLVVPVLTIVPGLIPGIDRKYFYFVGGVFVLSQVADYFSGLVILERSILLFLDILTIVLLVTLLRSSRDIREKSPNVKWGFTFTIMRLSILLLSISALANSLGNTTLSRIVSQGSLVMIYGGIIIYAGAIILKGLFALLIQTDTASRLNMIQNYSDEVKKKTFQLIRGAAVLYWLYITLSGYLIFDSIYDGFVEFITREWAIGPEKNQSSISIWNFLAFFITLWVTMQVTRFIRFILQDEILTHFEMPRGVPGAISLLVKITLMGLGIILAFGAAKIDLSQITILIGALGVGIGFGLQNIFNNLISGLILAFERPIQTGDIIQISTLNLMGEVKEIGIRASTIRTFDGAEVIVPNGNLISNEVINWTLSDQRKRQEILVGVKYGTDTAKVLEILNSVVIEQNNVLKNPAPFNIFVGFGDSSLEFRVLFWTRFDVGLGTKSAVGTAIDEAFKKNGIEIPFPQRDFHLRSVSDTVDFQKEKKLARATAPKKGSTDASASSKKNEKN